MAIAAFPDPRQTTEDGLLAVGGDLEPESLLLAYRQGIFPWPIAGAPLAWFCPPERAILDFAKIHVARSLARERDRAPFRLSINEAFDQVIRACARVHKRGPQGGTWITPAMIAAYSELHRRGFARSAEA